jgi:catechol 2,3-dioxygenase-like lactoylglutathione lyase family enzyme
MNIKGYDHVGIRVSDAKRALRFYASLGFRPDPEFSDERVAEILLDEPTKWPGYTHAAFIVDSLQHLLDWAASEEIAITEGPVDWGRRLTCFLRDPDGNVLEFNELLR